MSKDRYTTPAKAKKAKRVAAVSVSAAPPPKPPAARPGTAKPGAAGKPTITRPLPTVVQVEKAEGLPWSISLETALYMLIAVVAAAVRLYALDRLPLQESEAARAWAAWTYYRGLPNPAPVTQMPLAVFGAMVSFLVLGASDAAARLLPALSGVVCVLLPFTMRRDLGRAGALVAAALLALSPSLVFVSRSVDGGMFVAAGALVIVASALAYHRQASETYIYVAALALGIMFAADRTAGPTALILAIFAAVSWLRSVEERDLPATAIRKAAIIFIATAVLLGTGLLTNLQGVQSALVDPLASWITGATVGTIAQRLGFYVRILLAYEPFALSTALAGLLAMVLLTLHASGVVRLPAFQAGNSTLQQGEQVAGADSDEHKTQGDTAAFSVLPLLVWWAVAAFAFFILLGDQSPASAALIVLPVTLLAGYFIGRVLESDLFASVNGDVWILAFLFLLIALSFVPLFSPMTLFGGRFTSLARLIQNISTVMLLVVIGLLVALAVWYAYRLRLQLTLLAFGLAAAFALTVYTVHSLSQLNQISRADATEPMLMQQTAGDVRLMLRDVQAVSRLQGDDAIVITVDDRLKQPIQWYLRQFINLTVTRVGPTTKTPIVIVPAEAKDAIAKALGRDYVSQRYRLTTTWMPQAPLIRWLRWAHVREPIATPKGTDMYAFYKLPQ